MTLAELADFVNELQSSYKDANTNVDQSDPLLRQELKEAEKLYQSFESLLMSNKIRNSGYV